MDVRGPNCLTPAKQKAAVGNELPSKKLKGDEAMGDDVKSVDDMIPVNPTSEETPAAVDDDQPVEHEDVVEEVPEYTVPDEEMSELDDDEIADIFKTDDAIRDFKQYSKEYEESQGFDVVTFMLGSIKPLSLDNDDISVRNCITAVQNAVKFKNKQNNTNFKFLKITKCNYMSPSYYYATFEVLDEATAQKLTYQSQVQRDLFTGDTLIFMFRQKPGSVPEPTETGQCS